MKKILSVIVATTFTASAFGADMAWVKTNLWKSPYPTTGKLHILEVQSGIEKECEEFRKKVYDRSGNVLLWRANQMEVYRSLPSRAAPTEQKFSAEFILSGSVLDSDMNAQLQKLVSEAAAYDELPGQSQMPGEIAIDFSRSNSFVVLSSENSFTKVSESFDLKPLPMAFVQKNGQLLLQVHGRDTACDLISGKAGIAANALAYVKISINTQVALNEHYTEIEKIYVQAFRRYKIPRVRAAAFGVKLGNFLENSKLIEQNKLEDSLEAYMVQLFSDEKMTLSPIWKKRARPDELPQLIVDGSSEPVQIKLNIQ